MTISNFIRTNLKEILEDWESFASEIPAAGKLGRDVLRDHAEGILLAIADDIENPQTALQEEQKSTGHGPLLPSGTQARRHGADRVLEGFTINDTMSEYRALRASLVRAWGKSLAAPQSPGEVDLIRFNEAIDQALTESLVGYSDDRERRTHLYDTLLSASPDLSFIVDTDARLIYGNAAVATEFGSALSALRGKRFSEMGGHAQGQFEEHVRLVTRTKCTTLGEITRTRRGDNVTYEYLLVPVTDNKGETEAVAGIARDVTNRKAAEEKFKRSAQYDDLTGLPNRHFFHDRLLLEIKRADRIELPLALLFVDLDGFKQVNDLLGHEAGDDLLLQGAARIRQCVRASDTVARLGGDEFTVILTEIKHMPHVRILAKHILDELAREFVIKERSVVISGSVGIAIYPQDAAAPVELLRHADQAMYAAKQSGRNRYCFFTEEMREASWHHVRRIGELREAMAAHQFEVRYQPIVELAGGKVVGAEAQLCWQHPADGTVPAQDFADLAEETGLAHEIDLLVLNDTLKRAAEWHALQGSPLYVSIEKASLRLSGRAAEQQCSTIIDKTGATQAPVALEINEAMLLSEAPGTRNALTRLASAGIPLCLDDFGMGYSSISSLTRFPLAGVRIAPPLVHGTMPEARSRSLTKGIIASGHALGIKIIAAAVETEEQKKQLIDMGCDYAQGPLFFRAMDADAFAKLIGRPAAGA